MCEIALAIGQIVDGIQYRSLASAIQTSYDIESSGKADF